MTKTNETKCILAQSCNASGTETCRDTCSHYIALHSRSGRHSLSGIPQDYALTTLVNSPVRVEQIEAYRSIDAYAKSLTRQFEDVREAIDDEEKKRIKSLYLFSEAPGTGKTTTASALLNEYLRIHYIGSIKRGRFPDARPAYFLDVNALQTLYNGFNRGGIPDDIREKSSRPYYRMMSEAKSAPFAILDDIAVRSASEAFRSDLHDVINHRVTNGLVTVYTSNVPLAELVDVFDKRLHDRIRDRCIVINFAGTSKRGVRK
jgi:DNA replication protein DnaC